LTDLYHRKQLDRTRSPLVRIVSEARDGPGVIVVLDVHGVLEAFGALEGLPPGDDSLEVKEFPRCGFNLGRAILV
jgi:hypothetical protein